MKSKLFALLIGLIHFSVVAQCDLSINSWNATTGDIVIEAINSENCGCNEFTTEGNTCENSGSPFVNNNTTVSHIVLGLHSPGLDYNWGCTGTVNHPGWTFKTFTLFGNQELESGDTWSANVYDTSLASDCWAEILSNDTLCTEIVVWQINLSRTSSVDEGGWAVNGGGALQTQNYPDVNIFNNSISSCPPPDAPDAVIGNVEFETGCIGDDAYYEVTYIIWNYGQDIITDYCVEIWNEDVYDCYDSDSSGDGNLGIPPGFGQTFTSSPLQGPWNEGGFFVIEVSDVNDEIITGNNITTVFFPELLDCPIECESDTIIEYINITDTLYVEVIDTIYVNIIDTLYIELPPDTIIEYVDILIYITDTIYVDVVDTIYETDTIEIIEYVDVIDTLWLTEYIYDTIYVETIEYIYITDTIEILVDNYIYLTDTITITEYITQYIDCETGEPCDGIIGCTDNSIFVPNTFTPNNDGVNDTFYAVTDSVCWLTWNLQIYNRWGGIVWETSLVNDFWEGQSRSGHWLVPDGVYVWKIKATQSGGATEIQGYVTVFR